MEDLKTLRDLQKLLVYEVMRAEDDIARLKSGLRKAGESQDTATTKQLKYFNNRIEGFRKCVYIWRCFGDAIAFLYLDKFSLKQCFYSTESLNPKQSAGFIRGKLGLQNEISLLESALQHNVPALLVDLTNTIRHGDVCLLGSSDPYLLESKSSKKLNNRSRKQKRSLEKLHAFYDKDKCAGLRGFPELQRIAYKLQEQTYTVLINECIRDSMENGYATRQPEKGLYYVVLAQKAPDIADVLNSLDIRGTIWIFFLNSYKEERAWSPYYPFILSITDHDQLWNFIRDDLFIFVILEVGSLCEIATNEYRKATFDPVDIEFPLRIEMSDGCKVGISHHMLTRIGLEFVSPRWIVLSSLERVDL
jgi:hypothetical protein